MLKAEGKTKIIIILVVILIGKQRIAKRVSEVKGKEGKFNKNKFKENQNNERKRIGNEKEECWKCEKGAFPVGVSGQAGKQGVIELVSLEQRNPRIFILLIIVLAMLLVMFVVVMFLLLINLLSGMIKSKII